jgi:hypothetical protein
MECATEIQVAAGQVTGYNGIRFGGLAWAPATASRPARVRVAVRHPAGEFFADLREADTLRVAGLVWRLDAIHDYGHSWRADLTLIS